MAAKKSAWTRFPHPDKAFDYAGDKLAKAWPALHAGDTEPWATASKDDKVLAAWSLFHAGDFQKAFDAGQMRELGARCITLQEPVVERAIGVLTKPGVELSAAAQALFDVLRESWNL